MQLIVILIILLIINVNIIYCDNNICDGYYCHYATSLYDRLKTFYKLHAPDQLSEDRLQSLLKYADHEDQLFEELRKKYVRSLLVHKYDKVPLAKSFKRISLEELESNDPKFAAYKRGARPFILVGVAKNWKALEKWKDVDYITNLFPDAVVDFYPYNMLQGGEKPYLWRFKAAMKNQLTKPGNFPDDQDKEFYPGRYLHLQLTPDMYHRLRSLGDITVPKWFNKDKWWMKRCLGHDTAEEYHIKTHWQIILVGTRGAGMFNHTDSLMTSSWHTHIYGKKWWMVCGTNEKNGPNEGKTECFEDIMQPGDTLYYPRRFYHQTQNLETTTMTLTGTVVNSHNWDSIAERLYSECSRDALSFDFSGKLCDDLDKCYEVWRRRFTGKEHDKRMFRPWRQVATKESIQKKDSMKPNENNYDGRNFIGTT